MSRITSQFEMINTLIHHNSIKSHLQFVQLLHRLQTQFFTIDPLLAIKVFSMSVSIESSDLLSCLDAMSQKDAAQWIKVMKVEIQSIIDNKKWELSNLPSNRQVIGTKWVLKKKRDGNNNVLYYKARLVAKRYSQIAGLDFTETFAPVVRIESIHTLLAIAAFYRLYILHADAKTAFLNGISDLEL